MPVTSAVRGDVPSLDEVRALRRRGAARDAALLTRMRAIYTLLWWIALPLIPLRLWWRGCASRAIASRSVNASGTTTAAKCRAGTVRCGSTPCRWERRALRPALIERISREHPSLRIVLTAMTASGREGGRSLYGDRVRQLWLPYDLPFAVERFLDRFRPRAGVLMETELWPNLVAACARRRIPLVPRQRADVRAFGFAATHGSAP